jgi:plasmid stabilization system protein ParE
VILRFHAAARKEAESAARWYAARSDTASNSFVNELALAMERIKAAPAAHALYMLGMRYRMLKRYSYLIVFRATNESIRIIAVAHASRKPGYWKTRLANDGD